MKVAIIGASGLVGSALVDEAVKRDYEATGISRHPEEINTESDLITARKGDVLNEDKLTELLNGHDVVVSAFNAGWDNPNLYEDFLEGAKSIQRAVKESDVNRFLFVGGAGSLEIEPGTQLVDTPDFPEEYKDGALAARDYLDILREEEQLDWTFLSPAILMHAGIETGRTGEYRVGTDQPVFNEDGESKISPEDLAVAIFDELENGDFIQQRFTVAY